MSDLHPLSQIDAFFVAYQELGGILMQLGVEVELAEEPDREVLTQALLYTTAKWPQLGQTLRPAWVNGLAWSGPRDVSGMLRVVRSDGDDAIHHLHEWRNSPIDPFNQPPFQLLAILNPQRSTLAFRAHHSVCDGEAFVQLCIAVLRVTAKMIAGEPLPPPSRAETVTLLSVLSPMEQFRSGKLAGMWTYARTMTAKGRSESVASFALRSRTSGDISTCERTLDAQDLAQFRRHAAGIRVTLPWLFAAAWMRGIGAWNASKDSALPTTISLEIPVSLRVGREAQTSIGNFISPLVLSGESTRPLDPLSIELQRQFKAGLRQRLHLAVPLLTAPARRLPWRVFRKLAMVSPATGFATSHFTWLEHKSDVYGEIASMSGGSMRLLDHHVYTPVCLHMGAALTVFVVHELIKVCVTYRQTAFERAEVEGLLEMMLSEVRIGEVPRVSSVG